MVNRSFDNPGSVAFWVVAPQNLPDTTMMAVNAARCKEAGRNTQYVKSVNQYTYRTVKYDGSESCHTYLWLAESIEFPGPGCGGLGWYHRCTIRTQIECTYFRQA